MSTDPDQKDDEMGSDEDASDDDEFGVAERRKLKLQAYVASGIGKYQRKARVVKVFWEYVWPRLENELGWRKEEGTGHFLGAMNFFPSGVTASGSVKGVDYYDRIRGVLDRLAERRNSIEAAIADAFVNELEHLQKVDVDRDKSVNPRKRKEEEDRNKGVNPRKRKEGEFASAGASLDLSWKQGGRNFPKKHSRIGPAYQVSEIPKLRGEKNDTEARCASLCTLVWDPEQARKNGVKLDAGGDVFDEFPCSKKEAAILMLAECEYCVDNTFKDAVNEYQPPNGSDWTVRKQEIFRTEIYKNKKNMAAVCKTMKIDMKECLAYYYQTFKRTDDYRLLKTVLNDESAELVSGPDVVHDVCIVCDDGGELLICDGCEYEYHIDCLRPALKSVPEGYWDCDECVDRKLLAARDYLIRNTKVFLQQEDGEDEASNGGSEDDSREKYAFKPNPKAVEAIRRFAQVTSEALTITPKESK